MADPTPPQLPAGAPADLRAFIDCTADKVTLRNGKLDWLPLPDDIKDWAPVPDITYGDGPTLGSAKLTISLGVSFEIPASVQNGQLTIDTSGLPGMLPAGVKEALDRWVKDLNDWLKHNKKELKRPRIRPGEITLEKVPLAAPPAAKAPVVPAPVPVPAPPKVPPAVPPPATPPSTPGGWGCGGIFFLALVLSLVVVVGAFALGVLPAPFGGGPTATPTGTPIAGLTPTPQETLSFSPTAPPTSSPSPSPTPSPSPSGPVESPTALPIGSPSPVASPTATPPAPAERTDIVDFLTELGVLVAVMPEQIEAATIREEQGDDFRHDAQAVDVAAPADIEAGFVLVVPELTPAARELLFARCDGPEAPFRQVCGQQRRGEGPVNLIFLSMFQPFADAAGGSFLIADSDADPDNHPGAPEGFPLSPAQAGDVGFVESDAGGRRVIHRFEFDGGGQAQRTDAILLSGSQSVTWIVFGDYGAFTPAMNTTENQREYSNDVLGPLPIVGEPFPRVVPYDVTVQCGGLCAP